MVYINPTVTVNHLRRKKNVKNKIKKNAADKLLTKCNAQAVPQCNYYWT